MSRPQQYNNPNMVSQQQGNHPMYSRGHGHHPVMSRRQAIPHNIYTTIFSSHGAYQAVPRHARRRPISLVQQLEARMEASIPAPDPQESLASYLGVRVCDLNPADIIDPAPFRAARLAPQLYRARVRKANINLEINRHIQNPLHLLTLPQDIRNNIYDILFKKARMTITHRATLPADPLRPYGAFIKENMPTNILFVSKDVHTEAARILFANLVIIEDSGATDFDKILSFKTRETAPEVWNMDHGVAFSTFSRLRLSVLSRTVVINSNAWLEFTQLNSKQMYIDLAAKLDGSERPDRAFLDEVRMSARLRHTSFVAKINLACCYKIGQQTEEVLFRLSSETLVCQDRHDSIGHVYLDFVKEQAVFDRGDSEGHDACIMTLRRI